MRKRKTDRERKRMKRRDEVERKRERGNERERKKERDESEREIGIGRERESDTALESQRAAHRQTPRKARNATCNPYILRTVQLKVADIFTSKY